MQVMLVAALGIVLGLALGAALPFAVEHFSGDDIPAPAHYAVYPAPLVMAAAFGVLAALGFAILPLARAREIAPAGLFRDLVAPSAQARALAVSRWRRWSRSWPSARCRSALSPYPWFSLVFLAGAAAVLVAAALGGRAVAPRCCVCIPARRAQIARLALGNLTRPVRPR